MDSSNQNKYNINNSNDNHAIDDSQIVPVLKKKTIDTIEDSEDQLILKKKNDRVIEDSQELLILKKTNNDDEENDNKSLLSNIKTIFNMKKLRYVISVFIVALLGIIGVSFGWFNFTKTGVTNKVITGSLYLVMNEGTDTINLTNMFPETKEEARARNDNTLTFTVSGKNTSTNKPIVYEILLDDGTDVNGKERFNSKDLVFDLVEIGENDEETIILDAVSYEEFNDTRIWVDKVDENTTSEIERTYQLRMWLSDKVLISDSDPNANYKATGEDAFKNHYANIKVAVQGDLQDKELPLTVQTNENQVENGMSYVTSSIENTDDTQNVYKLNITSSNSNIQFIYDESNENITNISNEEINAIVSKLFTDEETKVKKLANENEPTDSFEKEYTLVGTKKITFNVHLVTKTNKTESTDLTFTLRKNNEKIQEFVKHVTVIGVNYNVGINDITTGYTGQPISIGEIEITNPDETPYTGEYTIEYYDGNTCDGTKLSNPPTNAGEYSLKITIPKSDKADDTVICKTITIEKVDREIEITHTGGTYTGSIIPVTTSPTTNVEVRYYTNNTCTTLIDANDEMKVPVNIGTYYAKAKALGDINHNEKETECKEHIILGKSLDNLAAVATLEFTSATYTGNEIKPSVTIVDGNYTLVKGTDYDVEYDDNINVGHATVTITLKGNYSGTVAKQFTITKAKITIPSSPSDKTYTGSSQNHGVTIPAHTSVVTTGSTLSATAIGNYKVILKLDDSSNYAWSDNSITNKEITWKIIAKTIDEDDITLSSNTFTYDGTPKEPGVTVKDGEETLVEGTDYDVDYDDNTDAGDATVTITLKGDYEGTIVKHFNIEKGTITIPSSPSDKTYTGTSQNHGVTVPSHTSIVTTGSTTSATNVGNYKVILKLDDATNYKWSDNTTSNKEISWKIVAKSSTGLTTTLSFDDVDYDGEEQEPTVTVKDGTTTLVKGTDYNVDYDDNTDAGEATVTITLKGNYIGTITKKFTINKKKITIPSSPTDKTYTGVSQNHGVTIPTNTSMVTTGSTLSATNADNYKIILKLDDATNYVWSDNTSANKEIIWKIVKSNTTTTLSDINRDYNGDFQEASGATSKLSSNDTVITGGTYTYAYYSDNSCSTITTTPKNTGTYYVKATLAATTNYNSSTSDCKKFVIASREASITFDDDDISLVYKETGNVSYTYSGDGTVSCSSSNSTAVTCNVDANNHKINVIAQQATSTPVTITVNASQGTYYLPTSKTFTVEVSKKNLTITAKNQTIDYGDNITTGVNQVTVTGLVSGQTINSVTLTASTTNVTTNGKITPSEVVIKEGTTTVTSNYQINYVDGSLTIEKIDATCPSTITAYSGTYDKTSHTITVGSNGSGGTVEYRTATTGDGSSWTTTKPTRTNVGETTVYIRVKGDSNHNDKDCGNAKITVNAKTLTGTVSASDKEYDGTTSATCSSSVTLTGVLTGDTVSATANTSGTFASAAVGNDKQVTCSGITLAGTDKNNYTIASSGTTTADINKKSVTPVIANCSNKTYDGSTAASCTYGDVSGKVGNETVSLTGGTCTFANKDVGTNKTVTCSGISLNGANKDNYTLSSTSATKTANITAKELTVTADNKSINYGGSAPSYSYTATGFVNSETTSVLTGTVAYTIKSGSTTVSNASTANAGTYTIVPSGLSATNYEISYQNGTLTINKIDAVCPSLTAYSKTYDGSSHGITVSGGSGGTIQYRTSTTGTWSNTAPTRKDQGTTTVYVQVLGDDNHNTKDCGNSTITVNKKTVTVTADNKSMNYKASAPTYSYTVEGAVGSETAVSGTATYTIKSGNDTVSNVSTANVGTYTIVPSGLTAGSNYSITYANGTLTINKINDTITITKQTVTYDGAAHTTTASATSGLTPSVTYYTNSGCTTKTSTSNGAASEGAAPKDVGTYYVTATTAGNTNYNEGSKSCTEALTINAKSVAVSWGSTTTFTYNGSAQAPTASVTSGVNGETINVTRTTQTNASTSSYTSTASCSSVTGGRAKCSNYTLTGTTKAFTINKATPLITLDSSSGSANVGGTSTFNAKANVAGTFSLATSNSTYATASLANTGAVNANTNDLVTVSAKSSNGTSASSTTITVYFTPSDTSNYNTISSTANASSAKSYTMTVNPLTRTAIFNPNGNGTSALSTPTGCSKNSSTGVITCTCTTSGSSTNCSITTPTISAPSNTPSICGYTTSTTGVSSGCTAHNSSLNLSSNPTYYAQTYKAVVDGKVTFNPNGNSKFTYNSTDYTSATAIKICTIAATYNGTAQNATCSASITMPTITAASGFTVVGWTSSSTGSATATYTSGQTGVSLTSGSTWYAQSEKAAITHTATFYLNGASKQTNASGTAVTDNTVTRTCTRAAVYNGATQDASCSITSPTITAASGFTVVGYNTSSTATSSTWNQNTAKTGITGNLTYYAITKSSDQITITFYKNGATSQTPSGGSASTENTVTASCYRYNGGSSCSVTSPAITRSGFTITGYGTATGSTSSSWNVSTAKSVSSNANYYAITSKVVTLTFYKNGNTSQTNASGTAVTDNTVTRTCTIQNSATSCAITAPTMVAANGFTIKGYSTGATTYSGYWTHNTEKTGLTADANWYAQSEKAAIDRTITLYKNGNTSFTYSGTKYTDTSKAFTVCTIPATHNGTAQDTSCTASIATFATIEAASTTPTIIGWSTGASTRTATYTSGQTNVSITMDANKSYYAQTSKAKVTLTAKWNANGATLSSTSNTTCDLAIVYNGATQATSCEASAPTITRSGFTITGYNDSASATTSNSAYNASTNKITLTSALNNKTWYAITYKDATGTFYYQSDSTSGNTTVSNASDTCRIQNSATSCSIDIPSGVRSSVGTYNNAYVGLSTSTGNMTEAVASSATTVTLTADISYYSLYRGDVSIVAPTSTSVCGTTTYYRNQWFTSTTAMADPVLSSTTTGTSNYTPSAVGSYSALYGYSASVNSRTRAHNSVALAATSNSTLIYEIMRYQRTGTFYYNSSTAVDGTYTVASTTAKAYRYVYCKTDTAGTTYNTSYTVPTAVQESKGPYGQDYAGTSRTLSAITSSASSAYGTFYAFYRGEVTNYYYDGSAYTSRTLYRISYFNTASEILTALSDSNTGVTDYTTAVGPGSSVWSGLSTAADTTAEYATIAAAKTSTATNLYTVYQFNVTYSKGANVSSIGNTSGSCKVSATGASAGGTSCTVTLPTITATTGHNVVGWSTTNGDTTGTAPGQTKAISTNPTTLYGNAVGNIYTATFNPNGNGTSALSTPTGCSKNSSTGVITCTCTVADDASNCSVNSPTITAPSNTPSICGYTESTTASTTCGIANSATITLTGNKTYYAQTYKAAITHTATFYLNGASKQTNASGTAVTDNTVTRTCTRAAVYNGATQDASCSITSPTITAASGFTVVGYNTSSTATSSTWNQNTAKTGITGNLTYYAITKSSDQITITFYKNGATSQTPSGGSASTENTVTASCYRYNGGSSCSVTSPAITRSGFTITGYGTATGSTSSSWNVSTAKSVSSNANYYAITSKVVTLTFYKNGNTSQTNASGTAVTDNTVTRTCTIQNSATSCAITAPTMVAANGFTIKGYSTGATTYSGYWTHNTEKTGLTADANWYAQSEKAAIDRTITLYKNGNTSFTYSGTKYTDTSKAFTVCTIPATHNGTAQDTSCTASIATFATIEAASTTPTIIGWSTGASTRTATYTSGQTNVSITMDANKSYYAQTSKAKVTLTAKWNANGATLSSTSNTTCDLAIVYNGATQATSCEASAPTITRSGFTITGYNDSASATTSNSAYNASTNKITLTSALNNKTWYAITYKDATGTFYYQSDSTSGNTTVSNASDTCRIQNSATSCSIDIPSGVRSSVGTYNNAYAGLSTSTGNMTEDVASSATTVTLTASTSYYSLYRTSVTIYNPTSTTVCSGTTYYRNQWFASTTGMADTVVSTSTTGTSNFSATKVSPYTTVRGFATTANTTTRTHANVAALATATETTYYKILRYGVTGTFYYNSSTAGDGTVTAASATATGYRYLYCSNTTTATTVDGNYTVPTVVTGSTGPYGQAYVATAAAVNSMSSNKNSANQTFYAYYRSNVTNYYYNGSAYASRTIYRNSVFTDASTMKTVLSTSNTGVSNYSTAVGPGSSAWSGLSTAADTTAEYASVASAATSTAANLYTVYQFNVTYNKGSNVSSIGSTSGSCKVSATGASAGGTSCTVTLPTISANTGYTSVGWNTSSGATTGTAAGQSYTLSSNPSTLYANATANELTFNNQTLNSGTYGTAYTSNAFTGASNGTGSYTYTIKSGAPTGATIDSASRKITFTNSTTTGTYSVVVTATDNGSSKTKDATMTISVNKVDATCPTLTSYSGLSDNSSHTITVSGGSGGTIQYRTSTTGTWTTTKPTRTGAGTSTVYVQVEGDANHNTVQCYVSGTTNATIALYNARIDFNLNGGTISNSGTNPIYVRKNNTAVYTGRTNSTAATIPIVEKTGYVFNGWWTAASGGTMVIDKNGVVQASVSEWTDANKNWLRTSTSNTANTNPLYAQYIEVWAENLSYDNTNSPGLNCTDVQCALDAIKNILS